MGNQLRAIYLWAVISVLLPTLCLAQSVTPPDEYKDLVKVSETIQPFGLHPFGENVSLYNGALSFEETDISLPGIGPTLQVSRTLSTAGGPGGGLDRQFAFGDWELDIPRIETNSAAQENVYGWEVGNHGSPGSLARCTNFRPPPEVASTIPGDDSWQPKEWWYGYHLIIPGEGSQELLSRSSVNTHTPASGSYPIVTKQDWMIGCGVTASDGGEGFVALAPDGTRYTFTHLVYRPMASLEKPAQNTTYVASGVQPMMSSSDYLDRRNADMFVTKVEDRFGNSLTYNWNASNPNNLDSIVASDGRKVTFTYISGTSRVQTVTVQSTPSRTWTYSYGTTTPYNMPTLTSVQLPDGTTWSYQMGNFETASLNVQPGNCFLNSPPVVSNTGVTGSATTPSGLTGTFTLVRTLRGHSYTPKLCYGGSNLAEPEFSAYPYIYAQFSLTQEVLAGPGVSTQTWTYSYSSPNASWSSDSCASNNSCPSTVYTDVVDPLGHATRNTFSNRWDATEGQLLRSDYYSGAVGSSVLRSVANSYAKSNNGPWPIGYGGDPVIHDNQSETETVSPSQTRTITQDGAIFTTHTNSFDSFARTTSETESSSLGYSKADTTSYMDDTTHWVLGLITQAATNGIVASQTDYDSLARPIHHYAFGKLESTKSWNADGTLHSITDGNNHATTFTNWYRGVPGKITYADGTAKSATVDGNGWVTSVTDENGFTTNYAYDPMGRLSSITYPTGDDVAWNQTQISLGRIGGSNVYGGIPTGAWVQSVHTVYGHINTYFDALWRPILVMRCDSADFANTVSNVVMRYDADGRLIFRSYPTGNISDYTTVNTGKHASYDTLGRVTQVQQDSELGVLTTTTQYLSGFQTKVTDPRGYTTTTSYQAYGEPTTEYPDGVTAPEGQLTVIMRDVFGKPLSITRTGTTQGSPQVTRYYVYRPDYQTLCKVIEPETGAAVMDFDGAGNLGWSASGLTLTNTGSCDLTTAWNSGRVVHRAYDARNRIVGLTFPDGNGNQTWTYTPDGLPNTITRQNNNGSNELVTNIYLYDKRRLLTSEALTEANWYTWTIGYGYDINGHLASVVYPTGLSISYAPNALGQPTQASWYATGVSYYPDGKVKQFTYHNGIVHTLSENTRELPSRIYEAGGGVTPIDQRYTYDKNGNPTAITDYGNSAENRTMTYDGLDRLAGMNAASMGGQYNYGFDVLDNLRTLAHIGGSTSTYNYDGSNRLASVVNTANGTTSFTYDPQGNLATKSGLSYSFDYSNRLRWVNGRESYRYDGMGRRILAWSYLDSQNILSMYSQAGQLMYQQDDRAAVDHHYLYLGSQLVAIVDYPYSGGSRERYQHTDDQGTVVAQTDLNRLVLSRSVYDSYGNPRDHGNDDQPGYTGHLQDSLTGLTYMQQRYYDPSVERFLSVDPVGVDPASGGNFNRYWYANDNPYRYTDPDGRESACFSNNFGCGMGQDTPETIKEQIVAMAGFTTLMSGGLFAPEVTGTGGLLAAIKSLLGAGSERITASEANKISHIFGKAKHGLEGVVKAAGGEAKALRAIEKATIKAVDASKDGKFKTIVKVGEQEVTVTGKVVDGQVKIGTAYIPPPPPPPPQPLSKF